MCNVSVALECMVMGTADSVMMMSSCALLCFAGLLPLTSSQAPSSPLPDAFLSRLRLSFSFISLVLGNYFSLCRESDSRFRAQGEKEKAGGNLGGRCLREVTSLQGQQLCDQWALGGGGLGCVARRVPQDTGERTELDWDHWVAFKEPA